MGNRYYGVLLERKLDGSIGDALGSDSILKFDNRYNKKNIGEYARQRMEQLSRHLGKSYAGYRIMNGDIELWRYLLQ